MLSVENKIAKAIKYRKRGAIFFSSDFVLKESLPSVKKASIGLTKRGDIIRLAPEIYCLPKIDGIFGLVNIYIRDLTKLRKPQLPEMEPELQHK